VSFKYTLRGTGIGLVAAGAVIAGIQYMGITEADLETGAQASELNIEEALALVEDHTEYFVIPENKYNEITNTLAQTELELEALIEEREAEAAEEDTSEEADEETPAVVNQTIFSIEAGMNSKDIAAELKVLEIIEDEREFERYLLDQEVDRYLRTGRYRLDSGMDFQEIVTVLTN
jgi:hypothetical protein